MTTNNLYIKINLLIKNKEGEKMEEKYLPIGSIVKLKNNDNEIMIAGYYSVEYNDMVEIYDYLGCLYPEGLLLKNDFISFNHDDIANCVFKGFENEKFVAMKKKFLNDGIEEISEENSSLDIKKNSDDILEIVEDSPNNNVSIFATVETENLDDDIVAKTNAEVNKLFDNNTNFFSTEEDVKNSNEDETIEPLQMISEEPKKEEFTMPHYRFDENGIIISE